MQKIIKTFFGVVLAIGGIAVVIFGATMALQPNPLYITVFFCLLGVFGLAMMLAGIAIVRGANVSRIIQDLFAGLP